MEATISYKGTREARPKQAQRKATGRWTVRAPEGGETLKSVETARREDLDKELLQNCERINQWGTMEIARVSAENIKEWAKGKNKGQLPLRFPKGNMPRAP